MRIIGFNQQNNLSFQAKLSSDKNARISINKELSRLASQCTNTELDRFFGNKSLNIIEIYKNLQKGFKETTKGISGTVKLTENKAYPGYLNITYEYTNGRNLKSNFLIRPIDLLSDKIKDGQRPFGEAIKTIVEDVSFLIEKDKKNYSQKNPFFTLREKLNKAS